MIKERPILMSAPMVRAILAGRKTQTRRLVKSKNDINAYDSVDVLSKEEYNEYVATEFNAKVVAKKPMALFFKNFINDLDIECPYGNVGDRLWVRETFAESATGGFVYRADDTDDNWMRRCWGKFAWTPSIHMPRRASRILLEITNVRIERLQNISRDDCIAEGIYEYQDGNYFYSPENGGYGSPYAAYKALINKINGAETWDRNPWVWVVEFKVIEVKGGCDETNS